MINHKWILITGAAKGLGSYLAKKLSLSGYGVLIHYRHSEIEAKALQQEIIEQGSIAKIVQGDFSTKEKLDVFISKVEKVCPDIYGIIHNVGNFKEGSFLNTDLASYEELMQVNVSAPYFISKAFISSIKKQKGHLIFLGIAGLEKLISDLHSSVYTLTKRSLRFLMKSLAKELAPFFVNVNMISPGYLEQSVVNPKSPLPMKRVGTYQEIYQSVAFLLNDANQYITGQDIEVAGAVRL